jgi:hypothetical protein
VSTRAAAVPLLAGWSPAPAAYPPRAPGRERWAALDDWAPYAPTPQGRELARARGRAKLSRAELAILAATSPSTIDHLEHGRSPGTPGLLARLEAALELPDGALVDMLPPAARRRRR